MLGHGFMREEVCTCTQHSQETWKWLCHYTQCLRLCEDYMQDSDGSLQQ